MDTCYEQKLQHAVCQWRCSGSQSIRVMWSRCWLELCGDAQVEGLWQDSWQALEQIVESGQIRSLGLLRTFTIVVTCLDLRG